MNNNILSINHTLDSIPSIISNLNDTFGEFETKRKMCTLHNKPITYNQFYFDPISKDAVSPDRYEMFQHIVDDCELCLKTKLQSQEIQKLIARNNAVQSRANAVLGNGEIPARYKGATITSMRVYDERQNDYINVMKRVIDEYQTKKRIITLAGNTGAGKTMMGYILVQALAEKYHCSVRAMTVLTLLRKIKESFNKKGTSETEIIEIINSFDVLFLDELGVQDNKEGIVGWTYSTLFSIIDYRYVEEKMLILTTNLTRDKLKKKKRLYERLMESPNIMYECFWGSYRENERMKGSGNIYSLLPLNNTISSKLSLAT